MSALGRHPHGCAGRLARIAADEEASAGRGTAATDGGPHTIPLANGEGARQGAAHPQRAGQVRRNEGSHETVPINIDIFDALFVYSIINLCGCFFFFANRFDQRRPNSAAALGSSSTSSNVSARLRKGRGHRRQLSDPRVSSLIRDREESPADVSIYEQIQMYMQMNGVESSPSNSYPMYL